MLIYIYICMYVCMYMHNNGIANLKVKERKFNKLDNLNIIGFNFRSSDRKNAKMFLLFLSLLMTSFSKEFSMSAAYAQQTLDYPSIANKSTTWIINSPSLVLNNTETPMRLEPILVRSLSSGPRFVCGFYCNFNSSSCLFSVLIFESITSPEEIQHAELVWSANRDNPVRLNTALQFKEDGDLALSDSDGNMVWSTKTGGRVSPVLGINLTELGNLVLFDSDNVSVWQSFDHPTDSLLPGQMLVSGQELNSGNSSTDWGRGQYWLGIDNGKLAAYVGLNSRQLYYQSKDHRTNVQLQNGNFGDFIFPNTSGVQFVRLESDGHLRVREWNGLSWEEAADLLTPFVGACGYPMVCGQYGVCSNQEQCSCPVATDGKENYFRQNIYRQPNLGCSLITPVSPCEDSRHHTIFELQNINYFSLQSIQYDEVTDSERCQNSCLVTCSCKAALFQKHWNSSMGNCLLLDEVFSLIDNERELTTATAFFKVQNSLGKGKTLGRVTIIVVCSLGGFFGMFLIVGTLFFVIRKKNVADDVEEDHLDNLPGMPARYSYQDLKAMTRNFSHKLGEGGFGSVFEGTIGNGTKVAVKQLYGVGLITKSFLAEVETIGRIHHVNLVRLIGFCAEKSHRLLVYEYMSNGSLNKWIFPKNRIVSLKWKSRKKIILHIAKGLTYLHEECTQKIFHLDIKPQNILLDKNFNAKVSDFGLSKLIDKDQSQVVTTLKGTPGYLAPEWLNSVVTEKVDVFSFGVVVLEILCGRKNLDRSSPEEDMHLLSLFKSKAEDEQLSDIIDKYSDDMLLHGAEVVEMMRVAVWCLQGDFSRRPTMSVVVKAVEGLVNVENNLDYNFMNPPIQRAIALVDHKEDDALCASTPLLPSILSGPR